MNYLYHRVPKNMKGSVLYPLNSLRSIDVEIYQEAATKYEGREWVVQQEITPLGCLWNDAIHLTAVHPADIKQALKEAGRDINYEFYEIDPHLLNPLNTTVYLYNKPMGESKEFVQYNPDSLEQFSILPNGLKEYYSKVIQDEKEPLLFHLIPHILYKGTIDISDAKIIKV
jgi:hypothetical protein